MDRGKGRGASPVKVRRLRAAAIARCIYAIGCLLIREPTMLVTVRRSRLRRSRRGKIFRANRQTGLDMPTAKKFSVALTAWAMGWGKLNIKGEAFHAFALFLAMFLLYGLPIAETEKRPSKGKKTAAAARRRRYNQVVRRCWQHPERGNEGTGFATGHIISKFL